MHAWMEQNDVMVAKTFFFSFFSSYSECETCKVETALIARQLPGKADFIIDQLTESFCTSLEGENVCEFFMKYFMPEALVVLANYMTESAEASCQEIQNTCF